MKGTVRTKFPTLLAVLALTLLVVGILLGSGTPSAVQAKAVEPAKAPVPAAQQADNSQCLACHSRPDQVKEFPNGDVVSIAVDEDTYAHSKHANLTCTNCHTNIDGYPHPENKAQSSREYTLQYANTCKTCHPNQMQDIADNAHAKLPEDKRANAPICADCHNPHTQPDIQTDANGDPVPAENVHIANICSKCHAGIVEEYKASVHGAALFEEANTDVPACADCHGVHKINKARTVEFRLNSPELCAECHTRADIMGKYGISTNVMNTYVADFHGTTVTLFNKEHTGQDTNKPVCYDCHGVHNIAAVDDPQKGLEIKANMLATCQRCHPDASENFSASWMSHYIATPTKFPLVYYVNLFYNILIPVVIGGMAIFVLSDILFRLGITGRKNRAAERAGKAHTGPEGKE